MVPAEEPTHEKKEDILIQKRGSCLTVRICNYTHCNHTCKSYTGQPRLYLLFVDAGSILFLQLQKICEQPSFIRQLRLSLSGSLKKAERRGNKSTTTKGIIFGQSRSMSHVKLLPRGPLKLKRHTSKHPTAAFLPKLPVSRATSLQTMLQVLCFPLQMYSQKGPQSHRNASPRHCNRQSCQSSGISWIPSNQQTK